MTLRIVWAMAFVPLRSSLKTLSIGTLARAAVLLTAACHTSRSCIKLGKSLGGRKKRSCSADRIELTHRAD